MTSSIDDFGGSTGAHRNGTIELWRTIEIVLSAQSEPPNPLADLEVDAVFTHHSGKSMTRPAFWDGGRNWRVRFAPTELGRWHMSTHVTRGSDERLALATAEVDAIPYSGELEIFQRGFLRVCSTGRYFEYADGTPFFYLGDTHWLLPHERLDTSNAPGIASQFAHMVDVRASQGFTVYQSEPIWQPHREWAGEHLGDDEMPVANLSNGFDASDLPGFQQLDRKFAYIADAGLVHANAQITWALDPAQHPEVYTEEYMARLARYWVARYGSYPVIWTIAQEIDNDMYGAYSRATIGLWRTVGRVISETDPYRHVIMPHMENTSQVRAWTSRWKSEPWHVAFGAQIQDWEVPVAREFWVSEPTRPTVLYETKYEDFWTDARGALASAYSAYQLGLCGYGYGVAGVWNDIYSRVGEEPDFGTDYELPARHQWWYDGLHRETARQLTLFRDFYGTRKWWTLVPRFDDPAWALLAPGAYLSSEGQERFVLLVSAAAADSGLSPGILRCLATDVQYRMSWFDPRSGVTVTVDDYAVAHDGSWPVPVPPTTEDWILTLDRVS